MKSLVEFLISILLALLIMCLILGVKVHSLDETHMDKTFKITDKVYILPDSTKGMVEDGWIFTNRVKDKITNIRKDSTFAELYKIIYTDKNGVIQRLRNVTPELLIKRNN